MKTTLALFLTLFSFASVAQAEGEKSLYDFTVNNLFGDPVDLSNFKGKVLMIVNTASKCGFTPQYKALESIYQKYSLQGFEILAFPSNDFGSQEPGSPKEIKNFCETKYKVTFPLFEKHAVSGKDKQALYTWLINNDPDSASKGSEVKWNFEKFLIGRNGKVIARFRSKVTPDSPEVTKAIEGALKDAGK